MGATAGGSTPHHSADGDNRTQPKFVSFAVVE